MVGKLMNILNSRRAQNGETFLLLRPFKSHQFFEVMPCGAGATSDAQ